MLTWRNKIGRILRSEGNNMIIKGTYSKSELFRTKHYFRGKKYEPLKKYVQLKPHRFDMK